MLADHVYLHHQVAGVFAIAPFFATWDVSTARGSALRAISDEALVTLDGRNYSVNTHGALPTMSEGALTASLNRRAPARG